MITKFNAYDNQTETKSYLSFNLGGEFFAIEVMKIMEILEVPKITKVPNAPDYLVGVVNLRGGVLPVVDTKLKFGMDPIEFSVNTCILVLNIEINEEKLVVGALADAVSEVFEIEHSKIQPSPAIGVQYRSDFISGMIKENEKFMMLLNIDKVFTDSEVRSISESQEVLSEEK